MQYYCYKTTNLVNGKFYYGVHSSKCPEKDNYCGSGTLLRSAIKKYGRENFKVEILKFFKTSSEAFNYERKLVTVEEVLNPNCYNLQVGGLGGTKGAVYIHKGKSLKRILDSQVEEYLNEGWELGFDADTLQKHKGKKISEEHKHQISLARKGKSNYWALGKPRSEETKQKISNATKGRHAVPAETLQRWSEERKNTVCLYKEGQKNIHVKSDEVEYYLKEGWKKGSRYKHSKETLKKMSDSHKGNSFVVVHNKVGTIKHISLQELDNYIKDGWIKGSGTSPTAGKTTARKGKILMYSSDGHRKYVDPKDIDLFLSKNYVKAR